MALTNDTDETHQALKIEKLNRIYNNQININVQYSIITIKMSRCCKPKKSCDEFKIYRGSKCNGDKSCQSSDDDDYDYISDKEFFIKKINRQYEVTDYSINSTGVRIYSKPTFYSKILNRAKCGEIIHAIGQTEQYDCNGYIWLQIKYNNKIGYVKLYGDTYKLTPITREPKIIAKSILNVTPSSLIFNRDEPVTKLINIKNIGNGSLCWIAKDDVPWIMINPSSGTGASEILVSINTSGLSPNIYNGKITISSADDETKIIPVTVDLTQKYVGPSFDGNRILASLERGPTTLQGCIGLIGPTGPQGCIGPISPIDPQGIPGIVPQYDDHERKIINIDQEKKIEKDEQSNKQDQAFNKDCCICFEEIKERITLIPCGHTTICTICIKELSICPLCKREINSHMRIY
jgi:hypothetical protein